MASEYLRKNKGLLQKRKQFREWYGYSAPRNLDCHDSANIIVPLLAYSGSFALMPEDRENYCLMASGGFSVGISNPKFPVDPVFVLGLLNSKLLFWKLRAISNKFRGGWITCTKQYFGTLPIRKIDFSSAEDKAYHDKMISLVQTMLDLNKKFHSATIPSEKEMLQRQIDATDHQIDKLVYELYGLTDEEIAIVEKTTKKG